MINKTVSVLLLVWRLRGLIDFPEDLSTPAGLADALERLLKVADTLAALTATTLDDDIVEYMRDYSGNEEFLEAAAAVLAFVFGKADEAKEVGAAFDAESTIAAAVEAHADGRLDA